MKRIYNLDKLRGLTIISMVLFHLLYNINFYKEISWYDETLLNKIWQLSISLSFFIISAITSSILDNKKNIIRGIRVSIIGFLISLMTFLFAKEQLIVWGVLNGLGLCMILVSLIDRYIKIPTYMMPIFIILFIISYKIPRGDSYIFRTLYEKNLFFLGFPSDDFVSSDYFPLIPYIFIYEFGFLLGKFLKKNNFWKRINHLQL